MNSDEHTYLDDALLARFVEGACTPEETAQVEAWLAASEANRQEFARLKTIWDAAALPSPAVNVDAGWAAMQARMKARKQQESETPVIPLDTANKPVGKTAPMQWMLRVAAVLVVALGAVALWRTMASEEMISLTASNEVVTTTLPDGSVITLNTNSSLEYPAEWETTRDVNLTGEAYFEVARNEAKPFVIHTGSADVKVLGTAFNVRAIPDAPTVEVAVESGVVALYSPENAQETRVELTEGDKGSYLKESQRVETTDTFDPTVAFWRDKMLIFKRTRLRKVGEVLSQLYGVEITFSNPALAQCKYTTSFENTPIEQIVEVIASSFGWEVKTTATGFEFVGDSCEPS